MTAETSASIAGSMSIFGGGMIFLCPPASAWEGPKLSSRAGISASAVFQDRGKYRHFRVAPVTPVNTGFQRDTGKIVIMFNRKYPQYGGMFLPCKSVVYVNTRVQLGPVFMDIADNCNGMKK